MPNGYAEDRQWSDRFLPQIKRILGEFLIAESPEEEDRDRNTDLIVLKIDSIRVGCRVRKYRYLLDYANEFTIRSERGSGNKTELAKIIEGWGRYLFYGFANEQDDAIEQWKLIDLNAFRLWFNSYIIKHHEVPGVLLKNTDGSSSFRAFNTHDMPASIVFAGRSEIPDDNDPF